MKELIGKITLKPANLPRKITVNKVDLFDQIKIALEFNYFFTNIGKNPPTKILNASTPFELKMSRVTPIYKGENSSDVSNYRPLSVLPCFSKILERIMYNRLYKSLIENNILCSKQFGFQNGHSTDHAVVQLVEQIIESFENNKYTLGVFIDLSKAFDIVDHSILLEKLELYGMTDRNHGWLKSYLSNRRQLIQINENEKTSSGTISCGVPQGSILGPLPFLLYVKDLKNASNILDPIMQMTPT